MAIGIERERTWPTNLSGTRALAVSYPYVLAVGGYEDAANRAVLLRLVDQTAETLGEWRLPFGAGDPAVVSLIDGRDDELHVARDQQWHSLARKRVRQALRLVPASALTARSLHCRVPVRLQSCFHRPAEPAGMPAVVGGLT